MRLMRSLAMSRPQGEERKVWGVLASLVCFLVARLSTVSDGTAAASGSGAGVDAGGGVGAGAFPGHQFMKE